MNLNYKILWFLSLTAVFFETYRQFMSYSVLFRGYVYFFIWFAACFILIRKFILSINYIYILTFLFLAFMYIVRGGDYENIKDISHFISLVDFYVFIPTIYFFYNKYCSTKQITLCLGMVFLIITYTMICTIPITIVQPGLIRETASNGELAIQLQQLGVMNYALPHAIIFTTPALCYGLKHCHSLWIKLICLLAMAESLVIVFFSEATTPLLLMIILIIVAFIYNTNKSVRTNAIRLLILVLLSVLLINDTVILFLLEKLQPLFDGTEFSSKAKELEQSLAMGSVSGADVEGRQSLMSTTIDAISNNLLIGTTNSKQLGGHNYLLDMLASVGLIGFVPLMIHIVYIVRKTYNTFSTKTKPFYLMGIVSFFIMISLKNVWGPEFFIFSFLMLPFLLNVLDSRKCFN